MKCHYEARTHKVYPDPALHILMKLAALFHFQRACSASAGCFFSSLVSLAARTPYSHIHSYVHNSLRSWSNAFATTSVQNSRANVDRLRSANDDSPFLLMNHSDESWNSYMYSQWAIHDSLRAHSQHTPFT